MNLCNFYELLFGFFRINHLSLVKRGLGRTFRCSGTVALESRARVKVHVSIMKHGHSSD